MSGGRTQLSVPPDTAGHRTGHDRLFTGLAGTLALVLLTAFLVTLTRDSGAFVPAEEDGRALPAPHPLEAHLDEFGVSRDGAPTGDLDGLGNSLSAEALAAAGWSPGSSVTVLGTELRLPDYGPGRPDHLLSDRQRVEMDGEYYSSITLLATATRTDGAITGAQGQGQIVYTDGSETAFDLSVPDWNEGPAGDAALNLPYANAEGRDEPSHIGSVRLYARSIPVDPGRVVDHVVMPRVHDTSARMHVFTLGGRLADHPWTGTWARAASSYAEVGPWQDQTLRLTARTTTGGTNVRVRLENTFAQGSVRIGAASIALRDEDGRAGLEGDALPLEFDGESEVKLPAGGQVFSDPVDLDLPPHSDIAVSLYLPGEVKAAPVHVAATDTSYATVAGEGDRTQDTSGHPFVENLYRWPYLTGVEVLEGPGSIATFGDSITDGVRTTRDAHARWPDVLSRRLEEQEGLTPGVLNVGVAGNHVVRDGYPGEGVSTNSTGVALSHRAPRDAFAQAGAETLVLWAGINDLRWGTGPAEVVEGLEAVGTQASEHGMRVFVATLGPCGGDRRCTEEVEVGRDHVNSWLREQARDPDSVFEAVWDFDAVLRDPDEPERLLPEYDSGDHLHPGDEGMEAVAESIDLSYLLR